MNILTAIHDAVYLKDEKSPEQPLPVKAVPRLVPMPGIGNVHSLDIQHSDNIPCDAADVAGMRDTIKAKVHPKQGPLVEFLATLQSLSAYIPDESARYHAAQDALKSRGVSVNDVLASISTASALIDLESKTFSSVRDSKTAEEVTKRESQIAAYAKAIQDCQSTIQDITSKRDSLALDLVKAKTDISAKTELFNGGSEALKREYAEQANKISLYLIGGSSK